MAPQSESDSDSDLRLLTILRQRASSGTIVANTATDAVVSASRALGAGTGSVAPATGASEPIPAAAVEVINLAPDDDVLPATSNGAPLVWLSGPTAITPPPTSSDPPAGAEIINLVSSLDDREVINLVSSSDEDDDEEEEEEEANSDVDPDRSDSDYDPAGKLPLGKQQKHYNDLGRRIEFYGEMKLKRMMENPNTSTEDYQVSSPERVRSFIHMVMTNLLL
jgi:hypothetical protein